MSIGENHKQSPSLKYHDIHAPFPSGLIPLYLSYGIAVPTTFRGTKLLFSARRLEERKQLPALIYLSTVPIMIRKESWRNNFDPLMSLYIESHHINRCKPVMMMGLLSLFLLSMNANCIAHTGLNRLSRRLSSDICSICNCELLFHFFS